MGPLGPRLGRRVRLELGAPVRFPSMTSRPLSWEPVGLGGSCPAWTPPWNSAPSGRADPAGHQRPLPTPLGVVGQAIDRVLLHRAAEATLKDFLDRLGAAMALSQPGPAARMPP